MFNIWNLHRPIHRVLVIDLTPAEAEVIRSGTTDFVAACLHACAIDPRGTFSWRLTTVRQSYYSDYLHSADWKARWDIAWIMEVTFSHPILAPSLVHPMPFRTEAVDGSAAGYGDPDVAVGPALLLASFPANMGIQFAVRETLSAWKAACGITATVSLAWLPQAQNRTLVRVLLDSIHFPADIDHLEVLLEKWQQLGGLTNWQDVLAVS